jgi:hypothetical protein
MAAHSSKTPPSRPEHKSAAPFLWGLGLMVCALLMLLSVISYSAEDRSLDDPSRIRNWIGAVGAFTGYVLIDLGFGRWAAIGVPLLTGVWGWTLMRRINWIRPFQLSAWLLALMLWVSAFLGLLNRSLFFNVDYLNFGQFGDWSANGVALYLGFTGAIVVMLFLLVAGMGLSIAGFAGWFERGVNKTIDKVSQVKLPEEIGRAHV